MSATHQPGAVPVSQTGDGRLPVAGSRVSVDRSQDRDGDSTAHGVRFGRQLARRNEERCRAAQRKICVSQRRLRERRPLSGMEPEMRSKRPRPASPDQVRITRERENTAPYRRGRGVKEQRSSGGAQEGPNREGVAAEVVAVAVAVGGRHRRRGVDRIVVFAAVVESRGRLGVDVALSF